MIKAVFFDWGHTLTKEINIRKKMDTLLKPYSLTWKDFYPYWKNFYYLRSKGNIKNDKEMFWQLKKVLQKRNMPFEKIRDTIILDSHIVPNENIEVVKEIKKYYKVGLITNFVYEWVEKALKLDKLNDLFDTVIVSSRVGIRKPNAEIFYVALKSLSVKPEEAAFVSDELCDDLISAKGCGVRTIWLDKENKNKKKKKEREIAKLFQPDVIVKNLAEVISIIRNL